MDIIIKMAQEFSKLYLINVSKPDQVIDHVREKITDIIDTLDRIKYLKSVLEENRFFYETHLKTCSNRENCPENFNREKISYFINQELTQLGANSKTDSFTNAEQETLNSKIDKILEEIRTLKDGQQIIYEDLTQELNELKDLYFLGKKKWYQIWIGKVFQMTLSGIITQTVSKQIVDKIQELIPMLSQ